MRIGETLNVFGRNVVLTNCDQATREFYQTVYSINEFEPIERPDNLTSINTAVDSAKKLYPWDTLKSSEPNCLSVELKERQQNMKKVWEHENFKLRFMATIEHDLDREFIITYYLENDTISVFEIGGRNFSSSVIFEELN